VGGGGIPPYVAAVVAAVVVVFGVIMFVVLYRRQMKYQQLVNDAMTSGGVGISSYNGYHSASDTLWDSNGMPRGKSIDMTRPLMVSEEETNVVGR
jgi:hypothetical protein